MERIFYNLDGEALYNVDLTDIEDFDSGNYYFLVYDKSINSGDCPYAFRGLKPVRSLEYTQDLEMDVTGLCENAPVVLSDQTNVDIYQNVNSPRFSFEISVNNAEDGTPILSESTSKDADFENRFEVESSGFSAGIYAARLTVEDIRRDNETDICFRPAEDTFAIQLY